MFSCCRVYKNIRNIVKIRTPKILTVIVIKRSNLTLYIIQQWHDQHSVDPDQIVSGQSDLDMYGVPFCYKSLVL